MSRTKSKPKAERPDYPYTMKLPDGRTVFVNVPGAFTDTFDGETVFKPDGVLFLDSVRVMAMNTPPAPTPGHVRALRGALGLTQEQFARKVGVEKMTVWRWEHGHMGPSNESVKAMEALRRAATRRGVLLAG